MRTVMIFCMLVVLGIGGVAVWRAMAAEPAPVPAVKPETHLQWVTKSLRKMQTIRVGMTRAELLTVFTTEGGLSTGLQRTYVYQECPYMKVDVTFHAVGRPERDKEGRVTLVEDPRDTIATISRPYMEWSIMD